MERRDLSGQVLDGRYHVLARIGRGAMGSVFRAEDKKLGRAVAVKIMNEQVMPEMASRRRFEREAQAMAKLEHPHCASILDVGMHEDQPFVVMDLVVGKPLDELVAEGPLPVARAVEITRQVLFGLAHAHEHGIIHRDIKPANIVLTTKAGVGDHVKILDFGLAKLGQETSNLTAGVVVGTPSYMSPEQIRGLVLDPRSDVYACGVLLYELLTGIKPYRRPNNDPLAVCMAHLNDPVPALAAARPGIAFGVLEDVVAHALAKDREHRFGSAMAFANALAAALQPAAGTNPPLRNRPSVTTPLGIVSPPIARVATADGGAMTREMPPSPAEISARVTAPLAAATPEPAHEPPPAPAPSVPEPSPAAPEPVVTSSLLVEDPDEPIHIPIPTPAPGALRAPLAPDTPVRIVRPPAPRRSRAPRLVLLVVAAGAIAGAVYVATRSPRSSSSGTAAPDASAPDAAGDRVIYQDLVDVGAVDRAADAAAEADAAEAAVPPVTIDAPPANPPADDAVAAILAQADQLVAQRRRDGAIALLVKARKAHPTDARLPYRAGLLYLQKLWFPDGLKQARAAIALDKRLRTDPALITAAVRAFGSTSYYEWTLARFLHDDIGAAAKPFLEDAAAHDRNPIVRNRARAELRRY